MASSNHLLTTLAIVALVFPSVSFGAEYMVGDDAGWTAGFDYAAWVKDKEFHVGDKLVFKFPPEKHNLFQVNGTSFKDCAIPPPDQALFDLNGTIILLFITPGTEWYLCGVGTNCKQGQKLAITILPAIKAPAAAPNSANGTTLYGLLP